MCVHLKSVSGLTHTRVVGLSCDSLSMMLPKLDKSPDRASSLRGSVPMLIDNLVSHLSNRSWLLWCGSLPCSFGITSSSDDIGSALRKRMLPTSA